MDTVLAIPELFEAILLYLPLRTLLFAQRTSKHFHHTISTSPTLQQALFLAPKPLSLFTQPQFNPLLTALFPIFFRLPQPSRHGDDDPQWQMDAYCTHLSDILASYWARDEDSIATVLYPEASWRRMAPVHPGVRLEKMLLMSGCQCGGFTTELAVLSDAAVKERLDKSFDGMVDTGLLWDLVVYIAEEWPGVRFAIVWDEDFAPALSRLPPIPEWGVEQGPAHFADEDGDGDDERDVAVDGDGTLNVVKLEDVARMSGTTRDITLQIVHSTECWSRRGDEVPESGLRVGDGGFVGKEEVVKILRTIIEAPQ